MAALIKTMIEKWAALYVRLSRDDENEGDSNSIAHQLSRYIGYRSRLSSQEYLSKPNLDIRLGADWNGALHQNCVGCFWQSILLLYRSGSSCLMLRRC